jgi:hypothetical protein
MKIVCRDGAEILRGVEGPAEVQVGASGHADARACRHGGIGEVDVFTRLECDGLACTQHAAAESQGPVCKDAEVSACGDGGTAAGHVGAGGDGQRAADIQA